MLPHWQKSGLLQGLCLSERRASSPQQPPGQSVSAPALFLVFSWPASAQPLPLPADLMTAEGPGLPQAASPWIAFLKENVPGSVGLPLSFKM